MKEKTLVIQLPIDFVTPNWPAQETFPLNLNDIGRKVESVVHHDIENSEEYMIITGFTSLSKLVDTFGSNDYEKLRKVKVLIGFEPNIRARKKYKKYNFDKDIKDYWLKRGFSIILGGAVIQLIEKINSQFIQFRYKERLHAKIYLGDDYAILGSSNFSRSGLVVQEEANFRPCRTNPGESFFYNEIKLIANNYYEKSEDYNNKITELLQSLIKKVTWQEALGRAIAELLEAEWLHDYKAILSELENTKLWPSQWKGISQAMTILQSRSNVLIADPTGAGKTKLCSALILSLKHWLCESGKFDKTKSLIVCPPLVKDKWNEEFRNLKQFHNSHSMGLLSNSGARNKTILLDELSFTNILGIDEAHNYLSPYSNRTGLIKNNSADYKILITATPISKKVEDLLRIIELLDVDNLSDEDFEKYKILVRKRNVSRKEEDIQMLRNFISQFTVRRTKKSLNDEIKKSPDNYRNQLGKPCRFPKQVEKIYQTHENENDKRIVKIINQLAGTLKGITRLTHFSKPNYENTDDDFLNKYIEKSINSAQALARYFIRSKLRSSHVALIEHIIGSQKTMDIFKFHGKTKGTGDVIDKLDERITFGKLPGKSHIFKKEMFPLWLADKEEYIKACIKERETYLEIIRLAQQLSGERELGKVRKLVEVTKKHAHVVAFDSTVITLYYFAKLFKTHYPNQKILVASGSDNKGDNKRLIEDFHLKSTSIESCIALCSDKMSEGVDLQKASAVMLLDMPSVLRIVEQRIGRVDRMDTSHDKIEIYWPNDSEEYSLKSDKRLITTNISVEEIYGSNIRIPDELNDKHFSNTNSTKEMISEFKDFQDKDEPWKGIHDSFQSIVDLKEGAHALIDEDTYEHLKTVSADVRTKVSFIPSLNDWCFIALKGNKNKAPKWYFIDSQDNIHTELPDICNQLRENIHEEFRELEWQDSALKRYINLFKQKERDLLPPKKKRALEVAEHILKKKINEKTEYHEKAILREMLRLFTASITNTVDLEQLAEEWVGILQPYLQKKREENKKGKKIYNMNSLKYDHKKIILNTNQLSHIIENVLLAEDIDSQIAACIIGTSQA